MAATYLAVENDRALTDMLDAERRLRAVSEAAARELSQTLVDVAVRVDGERLEKLRRADPAVPGKWAPVDWKTFFAAIPPRSGGWASLTKIIQRDTTEENRLRKQVAELQEKIEHLTAQVSRSEQIVRDPVGVSANNTTDASPAVPLISSEKTDFTLCAEDLVADVTSRLPDFPKEWPSSAVRRALDTGIAMQRYWVVLYLIGRWGICSQFEMDDLLGHAVEISPGSGSLRRPQANLVKANFAEEKKIELGNPKTSLLLIRLTPDGAGLFKTLFGMNPVETDWSRLERLHEGERFPEHTLAVLIFAMHTRKRGWQTHILPPVEGTNAVPDIAIRKGDTTWHVEVELSRKENPAKWQNIAALNQEKKVALCAATVEGRKRLTGDCVLAKLPGIATDLATLIKPKYKTITAEVPLWAEAW